VTTLLEPTVAPRPPVLLQGLVSGLLGAGLLGLAVLGDLPLLAGIVVVQLLVALGFLALVDAPASGGVFLLGAAATAGADLVVSLDDGKVGGLAGVVGLSLVGGLMHQLSRRERARVTESLADTFVVVTLTCSAVCLVAAQHHDGGTWPTRAALASCTARRWPSVRPEPGRGCCSRSGPGSPWPPSSPTVTSAPTAPPSWVWSLLPSSPPSTSGSTWPPPS
jgi:hypothetical protein